MKATTMLIAASIVALAGVSAIPSVAADSCPKLSEYPDDAPGWLVDYATECPGELATIITVDCANMQVPQFVACVEQHISPV